MTTISRSLSILFTAAVLLVATACGTDDSGPSTESLRGIWHHEGGGTNRVFVFRMQDSSHPALVGETDVYMFYSYEVGGSATLRVVGTYQVEERPLDDGGEQVRAEALVTRVLWSEIAAPSTEVVNAIREWNGDSFILAGAGDPNYIRVDAIP